MSWYHVCEGEDSEQLAANVPEKYKYVPYGRRMKILYNTSPFPVAEVFDLAGAELPAKLLAKGGKLIDASANGLFEIQLIVESVQTGEAAQGDGDADMASPPTVVVWIGVISAIVILSPLLIKMANLFADFVPSSDGGGGSSGGGLYDYFKNFFGDYTPYVLIGGALLLVFLLRPTRRDQGPPAITYLLPGGK